MKIRSQVGKAVTFLVLASFSVLAREKAANAMITAGNPLDYLVDSRDYTGVVSLKLGVEPSLPKQHWCTGSLIHRGWYILTAAHCLTNAANFFNAGLQDMEVVFSLRGEEEKRTLSEAFIFSGWNGDGSVGSFLGGGDLAVLKLAAKAPRTAQIYGLYDQDDEVGKVTTLVGYGSYGTGSRGGIDGTGGQTKMVGENKFDALTGELLNALGIPVPPSGNQLLADFDSSLPENDALGLFLGRNDLGLGMEEVAPYTGDSGAPLFINGKIAGVVSYGISTIPELGFVNPADIDDKINGTIGEMFSSTRISMYSGFIQAAVGGRFADASLLTRIATPTSTSSSSLGFTPSTLPSQSVPEPASGFGLLTLGALGIGLALKGKKDN